jgi:hypothetical protein
MWQTRKRRSLHYASQREAPVGMTAFFGLPLLELDVGHPDDFGVAGGVLGERTGEFRR